MSAAREAGFSDISERLVTDWVTLGLLDQPERTSRGKGQGRGAFYEWSENQRDLFLTLLAKRDDARSRAAMCVIPVGIWLYWGDEWVPLRQVKIALRTWWGRAGRVGYQRGLDTARLVVDTMAPPKTPRAVKAELRELVVGGLWTKVFPREEITGKLHELLMAGADKGTWGPYRQTAEEVTNGMWSMVVATQRYEQLTDGMFREARARLRPIALSYISEWPTLKRDPTYGQSYEQPTWDLFINGSCRQLLIGLGLQLLAEDDGRTLGPVGLEDWTRPPPAMANIPTNEVGE